VQKQTREPLGPILLTQRPGSSTGIRYGLTFKGLGQLFSGSVKITTYVSSYQLLGYVLLV